MSGGSLKGYSNGKVTRGKLGLREVGAPFLRSRFGRTISPLAIRCVASLRAISIERLKERILPHVA